MTTHQHIEVRHGFTLRDLEEMTRAALLADRSMAADITDRRDAAWHAIAEHLCLATEPPTRAELIRAGWQAIYREVRDGYRHYGYHGRDPYAGHATAPEFVRYWYRPVRPSHEERVVEELAVAQILVTLTDARRAALTYLATWENTRQAAETLGIAYDAFMRRIHAARRHIDALWHEGETPYWPPGRNRGFTAQTGRRTDACGNGHPWTPETTRESRRMSKGRLTHVIRQCRICEKERTARRAAAVREAKAGAA